MQGIATGAVEGPLWAATAVLGDTDLALVVQQWALFVGKPPGDPVVSDLLRAARILAWWVTAVLAGGIVADATLVHGAIVCEGCGAVVVECACRCPGILDRLPTCRACGAPHE